MIFQTFDPYYNDEIIIYENKMCFICYEIETEKGEKIINLNSQELYIRICSCKGLVHNKCLDKWYEKSNKCPICRITLNKKKDYIIIFKNINYYYYYYVVMLVYFYKNIYKFLKFISIILFFYYGIEFYIILLNKNYYNNRYSKYNYNYNNNNTALIF
jgi:hypothetical protein